MENLIDTLKGFEQIYSDHLSPDPFWYSSNFLFALPCSTCCSSASLSLSLCPSQQHYNSFSFCPIGGFTFNELMQRGVPLHLIDKYINETKVVEEEKWNWTQCNEMLWLWRHQRPLVTLFLLFWGQLIDVWLQNGQERCRGCEGWFTGLWCGMLCANLELVTIENTSASSLSPC